jgi:Flp pilus assembly pilin Flp
MVKHPGSGTSKDMWGLREDGQASVEYAILAAAIIAVCVATIQVIGTDVAGLFNSVLAAF